MNYGAGVTKVILHRIFLTFFRIICDNYGSKTEKYVLHRKEI